jgi:hypothetical protein
VREIKLEKAVQVRQSSALSASRFLGEPAFIESVKTPNQWRTNALALASSVPIASGGIDGGAGVSLSDGDGAALVVGSRGLAWDSPFVHPASARSGTHSAAAAHRRTPISHTSRDRAPERDTTTVGKPDRSGNPCLGIWG